MIYHGRPTNLSGYTPKNKKLLTYPYCYLTFNPSGNIYRYEDFINGVPLFNAYCEINPNPEVRILPKNYHGFSDVININSATLTGFPTISWSVDVYNVWLAQNTNFINLKMKNLKQNQMINQARNLGDIASAPARALTFDIGGALQQTANAGMNYLQNEVNYQYAIKEQTAQIEYHDMLPNETNWGDKGTTLIGYNLYRKDIFTVMTIKAEFAKIIDNYFDMYGYQRNLVKVPNLNNRPNWNYIKTINANIIGNIPELDILAIKSLFDNGITLWHNPNTYLDYGQNNR